MEQEQKTFLSAVRELGYCLELILERLNGNRPEDEELKASLRTGDVAHLGMFAEHA